VLRLAPPQFLIHDRDSRYGASFDRRVRGLGIRQVRTPFRSPRANAVAERWVRSVRSECLDHLIVFNEANLRRVLSTYVTYCNRWRPHRSLGQAVHAARQGPSLGKNVERSSRNLCLAWVTPHLPHCCMTSFCAPQAWRRNACSSEAGSSSRRMFRMVVGRRPTPFQPEELAQTNEMDIDETMDTPVRVGSDDHRCQNSEQNHMR
jgi:Integrase core domain